MRPVVILGRGASGKSTLAERLAELTGLSLIELDKISWQPAAPESYPSRNDALNRAVTVRKRTVVNSELLVGSFVIYCRRENIYGCYGIPTAW